MYIKEDVMPITKKGKKGMKNMGKTYGKEKKTFPDSKNSGTISGRDKAKEKRKKLGKAAEKMFG